jgi:hypothetical protein
MYNVYWRFRHGGIWKKVCYFVYREKPAAAVDGEPGGLERQGEVEVSLGGSSPPVQRGKA